MKTVSTIAKLSTIAKMIARDNPEAFQQACQKSEPMLKNVAMVPLINSKIKEEYPELDKTDLSILFAGTVYYAFSPASLESPDIERAPNGIRQQMCNVMDWKDAPTCNYYKNISAAYFKGKSFKEKVNHILSFFQGYSVKSNQIQLF